MEILQAIFWFLFPIGVFIFLVAEYYHEIQDTEEDSKDGT